ncbi:Gfo/Idh/MocA family oxidoreductase [Bacillus sp. Marseille-P3661]|uniref:Gfo/Idh/MocA family oxidoreductase n=1 Tax=Bacillus sp. Marseille-P3661 TaxID=1936234 RepID=UPI000C849D36|nr:Gfo/Idh/MocA family oxidoreductase [Bacillus sp. Marseille-P3661]
MNAGRNNPPHLRIGIIGLGNAGSALIPAILKHPHVSVSAASGRNKEKLEKFSSDFGAKAFYSIEDICRCPEVDAVYIATPTEYHDEHVRIAAENKKHIIVEKPIAVTLDEASNLIHLAEKNGVQMMVGHSHSFEPPIKKMREVIASGELGKVRMINNWYFNDWIYRPRIPTELDTKLGGGITYRQGSHQFDIIRYIGGGAIRSVRAMTGKWDPTRPTEGAHTVFLEFEDGTAATAVYNGYDHFHTTELTFGIGEGGPSVRSNEYGKSRFTIKNLKDPTEETLLKSQKGYGGKFSKDYSKQQTEQPFFGLTLVSCERGDIRQSPNGLYIYGDEEKYEITLDGKTGRDLMIEELYDAIYNDKKLIHDGHWGMANLEVCIAVLESSEQRKEVYLQHQVSID